MICLILVWCVHGGRRREGGDGGVAGKWGWGDVLCVCVCGKMGTELVRDREGESVSLDQLHSKSVYSAQFGIKHNRVLSACFCLWCPIKMEFIGALRVSPNYTISLSAPSLPSSFAPPSTFSEVMSGKFYPSILLAAAVRQLVRAAHYRPMQAALVGRPTYNPPISAISTVIWLSAAQTQTSV